MTPPLLDVRGLRTEYRAFGGSRVVRAVDDVSFTLERGQTIKRSMWSAREGAKSPFQEAAQALSIGLAIEPLN